MSGVRLLVTGALLGGAFSPTLGHANAASDGGNDANTTTDTPENITVSGVRSITQDKLADAKAAEAYYETLLAETQKLLA